MEDLRGLAGFYLLTKYDPGYGQKEVPYLNNRRTKRKINILVLPR